jgi:hypothetical protein
MNDDEKKAQREKAELLGGGSQIAEFLFGAADKRLQRRVYHLAEFHDLPAFRIGNTIYARKSKLLEWVEMHEKRLPFK